MPHGEGRTWSADELRAFLDSIREDRLHMLYLLLAVAGLRRGEAVALRWEDVDLNAGTLRVHRSAVKVGGDLVVGEPKSARSRRLVVVDDETARRLHWHQCRQRLELLGKTGTHQSPSLVFTTTDGESLDPSYVS